MLEALGQNGRSFLAVTLVVLLWVEGLKALAKFGWLSNWQRRKLMHCLTGPIFLAFWPWFGDDLQGAVSAAMIPLGMTAKFVLIGLGILDDPDTVNSISRSGDRAEILRGPLLYGLIFAASTVLFWKQTAAAIYLLSLCFGDGVAEISGRALGRGNKLFWSRDKSLAGSLGFLLSAVVSTLLFFHFFGYVFQDQAALSNGPRLLARVVLVNVAAALIESITSSDLDNLSIFIAAAIADRTLLHLIS